MNIALFSDNFYPELSGIGDMLLALADGLAANGHGVLVCAPRYPGAAYKKSHVPYGEYPFKHPVTVLRYPSLPFPTGTKQGRLVLPSLHRWKQLAKFKPDIIHTQLFFGMGLEALQTAKKLNVPLLGTNHTVVSEFAHYAPFHSTAIAKRLSQYVIWYYNQCAYVTAPAQSLLTSMAAEGLTRPHQTVPNPIDEVTFVPVDDQQKATIKQELKLSPHTICYAGRLAPEKRIDECIQAMPQIIEKIPDAQLVLAGHGSERERLIQLARGLGVTSAVKFLGTLNKPALAQLYAGSDVFATMSASENQPLTLLQAYCVGLPAVGAHASGLIEHIPATAGLQVEPHDIAGLAHALTHVLTSEQTRLDLGRGAMQFAKQFATKTVVRQWEEIYSLTARI